VRSSHARWLATEQETKKAGKSFAAEVSVLSAAAQDITVGQRFDGLDLSRSGLRNIDPGTTRTPSARVLAVG
jgi:hypothetical protein